MELLGTLAIGQLPPPAPPTVEARMTTDKSRAANRKNALRSTGPNTADGVLACKYNALRHGLRALQTLVPGENPDEWAAHREAVVADLRPVGAVEYALAENIAVKLWRLGRVVRHEVNLIANAQDREEILHAHEKVHRRVEGYGGPGRTDIPTRKDVVNAKAAVAKAEADVARRDEVLRLVEGLAAMEDDDTFPSWNPLYEELQKVLSFDHNDLDRLFENEDADGEFLARHARTMMRGRGELEEVTTYVLGYWRQEREALVEKIERVRKVHQNVRRRFTAALDRRRRAHGLPGAEDLDRIQRYEAHLERGLHKALDRLRDLQVGRGAIPPRGPSLAVAVVQTKQGEAPDGLMGPFGSFALENHDLARIRIRKLTISEKA
jgi:hypothetical protein